MNAKTLTTLLPGVGLFAVPAARAANPRSHHLHGVVQSIDATAHTLTVRKSSKTQPMVILWNEHTSFRDETEPAKSEDLRAGQSVCVRYRVLPGRLEASYVVARRENTAREKDSAKGGAGGLPGH